MAEFQDDLVLGRGKIYFDRFTDGTYTKTGELFLGNAPQVQLTQNNTKLDHYRSTAGLKVKDKTVTLQSDMSGTVQVDNLSMDNLALWFLGENLKSVIATANATSDAIVAKKGTFVQLGKSLNLIQGARNVSAVTVTKQGGAAIAAANNLEIDLKKGRVYIESDAPDITDGDALTINYTPAAGSSNLVVASGKMIFGALRFIADNPIGTDKDYFFPYVQLTSSGNLDLIADTWQTASFSLDVLKLDDATERLYVTN